MDIGIVHPELIYPRGAEKQVCKVAYYLNRMGHDVTIYLFEKKDNYVFDPLLKHVKLVSLDKKWFLNYLLGFNNPRWNQLIKEIASKLNGHDVINAQNHPAQWISAYTDIPTVWNCNEPYPYDSLISRLFYRKDQTLSSNVKLIVSHNLTMTGLIHDIYPDARIEMAGT